MTHTTFTHRSLSPFAKRLALGAALGGLLLTSAATPAFAGGPGAQAEEQAQEQEQVQGPASTPESVQALCEERLDLTLDVIGKDRHRGSGFRGTITVRGTFEWCEITTTMVFPHRRPGTKKIVTLVEHAGGPRSADGTIYASLEPKGGMAQRLAGGKPNPRGPATLLTVTVDAEKGTLNASWRNDAGYEVRRAKTPSKRKELKAQVEEVVAPQQVEEHPDGIGGAPLVGNRQARAPESLSSHASQQEEEVSSAAQQEEEEATATQATEAPARPNLFVRMGRSVKRWFKTMGAKLEAHQAAQEAEAAAAPQQEEEAASAAQQEEEAAAPQAQEQEDTLIASTQQQEEE
jgi:DNA segregation ATPase FtsK/SpoIIIE-like protein